MPLEPALEKEVASWLLKATEDLRASQVFTASKLVKKRSSLYFAACKLHFVRCTILMSSEIWRCSHFLNWIHLPKK
jgi:hypothetical protein